MAAQSLSSLLQRATIDDHEEVLQSCNAALAKSKSDLHAQHIKAVALLKLDRYEDCLRVFEEAGDGLKKRAALEYAYALYKCGQLDPAIEVVSRVAGERGALHLEAQASYRSEKFRRAAEIYEELSKDDASLSNEENDLRINSWATDAQLQWKGYPQFVRHNRPMRDDLEAFETVYNAACLSIAKGEFQQGQVLLTRAKELCRTSEDLTPEDRAAELLPIAVQQLYVLLRQGKSEEAQSVLEEISVSDIPELSTKKIAQTNITLARGTTTTNPFALYKALHEIPDSTDSDKLFEYQDNLATGNSYAADLLVQKYDGIIRSTSKALAQAAYPSTEPRANLLSVYNAAAHARGETGTKALKRILSALDKRPKDLGLALTAVQLYVGAGNTTSAITTLERTLQLLDESISEQDKAVRFNPGLLSILVSLYKLEGRKVQIRTELAKAATYWQAQAAEPPASLLRAAGASLLHSSDRSDLAKAGDLFKSLYQKDTTDQFAVAGYVASQATLDYSKVEAQVDTLPSVADLISGVNIASLENAGISPSSAANAAAAAAMAGARKRSAKDKEGRATKRVRKDRLPKDYDPSKTPDPERWLPLRDRSSYRPKGRKGKQRAAERTQGGVVNEKAEESPAPPTQKAQGGGGGGSSKKNKKKGKR
ncbi:signal recognition particle subunit SRP72 [Aspergillus awamori]|uniref:Signal recognition particle subunit SRP72 n=1 Tax=Aspergillus awamori TaxID=105351 RepID=A0A401KWA5_ASPAW|nr:signal recognition particle subunit SRP72 [Aspergillus awamori]GKZ56930.1 signal recognition particle core component [Aspergillus niger]GLA04814.1 signal recognition particle core component [Aspergillus niger]GLA18176.1 signal recognition particle core component [Aspergillus niger]GLA38980.1 signal recognition particle core component [Aspergillus niger]